MTAAIASLAPARPGLLDDYLGHLHTSGLGERAVRDRSGSPGTSPVATPTCRRG
jgi:hypothetical protein